MRRGVLSRGSASRMGKTSPHPGTDQIVAIPTALRDLFGYSATCGCGRTHSVTLAGASIRAGALDDLVPLVRELGTRLNVGVVADRNTREICAETAIRDIRADGHTAHMIVVPDGAGDRPHADEKSLLEVESALAKSDLAVAVGSGTINDLTKLASFKRGIDYISVATAPSMASRRRTVSPSSTYCWT